MRRFLTLVSLLCLAVPAGITFSGCTRNPDADYCNGLGYGTKVTDVAAIDLEPKTTGVSLYFGKTQQLSTPTATTCKDATVSVSSYTYGTSNQQLVDVSPTGNLCAGTWNRNSGGSVADYTQCSAPDPLPTSKEGLPYATASVTATASSISSNPVTVYVHAQTTAVSLVTSTSSTGCFSQGVTASLDAQACYSGTKSDGTSGNVLLCAPSSVSNPICPLPYGVSSVPACSDAIGILTYTAGTSSIATIDSEDKLITAKMPGTTLITATVAGTTSSAGYFTTCPPRIITVTTSGGDVSASVTQGVTQSLVTTIYDTNTADYPASGSTPAGKLLSGLTLDYQSTNQADTSVSSAGAITASYPGQASIFAVCQPPNCNPAPTEMFGLYGSGLSLASNHVAIVTPGSASSYAWFGAPGQSQYFVPVDLSSSTISSGVRLSYVPNSMVMDPSGTNLYFGSAQELMVYTASTNSFSYSDSTVPGVVLAVSPDNSTLLINDESHKTFYLYSTSSKAIIKSFGGVGSSAAWTPDSSTLYITDSSTLGGNHSNTLYVYNSSTGLTTCDADVTNTCAADFAGAKNLAVMTPGVGAYFSGSSATTSRTWCPTGTVGDPTTGTKSSLTYYPQGDTIPVAADALAVAPPPALSSTTDTIYEHLLGAAFSSSAISLYDSTLTVPTAQCPIATTTPTTTPLTTYSGSPSGPYSLAGATNPTAVNQVLVAPDQTYSGSFLAFVTYSADSANTSAALPYYRPGASSTPGSIALTNADSISAPVAGAFSNDYKTFFVSTAGDNKIHLVNTTSLTDTKQISPNLPACATTDSGCTLTTAPSTGYVPATVIAVKPRATT